MADPLRGLLLDFGGVLTTNIFDSFSAFCDAEGLDPVTVRDAFRSDPVGRALLFDLELGKLDEAGFEAPFCRLLGLSDDRAPGMIERLFGGMKADHAMLNAVRAFKGLGVRTGLLSNSWGEGRYDRSQFPELFDAVVISAEEGMRKPDPEIYALATERMGLPPEEIVFVDDLPGNLKPARAMGMVTLVHVSAQETVTQLEELLGMTLRSAT